jgi:hypothetical protein
VPEESRQLDFLRRKSNVSNMIGMREHPRFFMVAPGSR